MHFPAIQYQLIVSDSLLKIQISTVGFSVLAKKHDEQIYEYLQKVAHLTDEQKTAMMNYEPFLGMTIGEARIAMRQIEEPDITFNSKALRAVFIGQRKTKYVLIFNLGTPNRVVEWTTFTDEEVKEISKPRDHRPNPLIPDY